MDHPQIQLFDAHPFLSSIHFIPCLIIIAFETSVQARGEPNFQRIQEIVGNFVGNALGKKIYR